MRDFDTPRVTPEIVSEWVEHMRTQFKDFNGDAHEFEDELRHAVLNAIANGTCVDPAECARIAASSSKIDVPRWYQ